MALRLEGKVAVVTGAGSGIGRAIAQRFAAEGAAVIVADVAAERAMAVAAAIEKQGARVLPLSVDVTRKGDVESMVEAAHRTFGRLDILVNNAGVMDGFKAAGEVEDELWDKVMAVNLRGPLYAIRAALPVMLEQRRGAIVNIGSVGGTNGARAGAAYTASKWGLSGLTKNVAFYYKDNGIRANLIAPGGVKTGMPVGQISPLGQDHLKAMMALPPRQAEPEEIASVALFLASDEASFVNGAIVVADGGWTSL